MFVVVLLATVLSYRAGSCAVLGVMLHKRVLQSVCLMSEIVSGALCVVSALLCKYCVRKTPKVLGSSFRVSVVCVLSSRHAVLLHRRCSLCYVWGCTVCVKFKACCTEA